jgi:uncharacterized protein involved in type VI secretion and phage assembly
VECIGDITLRPGNKIEINGVGKLFSGLYYISSAKHTYNESGYRTTLGVRRIIFETEGGVAENQGEDILYQEPREKSPMGQMSGVVIGIITNNTDDPKKLGRVKVQFPWRSRSDQSDWVRVATGMAGKEYGSFFLPEVGDEVLVAFDRGDLNHPYVIGSLWNSAHQPPVNNADGKNNIRKIMSRSGHEIVFTDDHEQQKEKLEIRTKAGHQIVLDDSSGQEKVEIVDKTEGTKIIIDSAQKAINIESAGQLKIKAQQIEIETDGMLTIKASANLTIQGQLVKIN